jgi:hypothetical protein
MAGAPIVGWPLDPFDTLEAALESMINYTSGRGDIIPFPVSLGQGGDLVDDRRDGGSECAADSGVLCPSVESSRSSTPLV